MSRLVALGLLTLALAGCPWIGARPVALPQGEYVAGELLVQVKAGVSHDAAIALHQAVGATPVEEVTSSGLWRVSVNVGSERDVMDRYRSRGEVDYAEANVRVGVQMVGGFRPYHPRTVSAAAPSDPLYGANPQGRVGLPGQWGLNAMKVLDAWDRSQGSAQVTVGVLDTGADMGHEDLVANLDTANAHNFVEERSAPNAPDDDYGHGTHVAGIIAAVANNNVGISGVAPGCKILPLRVLGADGGSASDLIRGLEYAIGKHVKVVNISLGSNQYSRAEDDEIHRVIDAGITVVSAAGNEALSGNPLSYPGALDGVISVAALQQDSAESSGFSRAPFSNFNPFVTVAAPGVDILSTLPRRFKGTGAFDVPYGYASGTSMASPMVAGVVALMLSQQPTLRPAEVASRLRKAAADLGPSGSDQWFGAGLVQAPGALP